MYREVERRTGQVVWLNTRTLWRRLTWDRSATPVFPIRFTLLRNLKKVIYHSGLARLSYFPPFW